MAFRQVVAASLVCVMALGTAPLLAQSGSISGRATDEAESPYQDYTVQIVRLDDGTIVGSQVLDAEGLFSIGNLPTGANFEVQLIHTAENNELVCTERTFRLSDNELNLTDVNIDCGRAPAALWILAGAAGVAAAVGVLNQSNSQ